MLTGERLRQYLAYKVLDRESEPERKPPVKAKRATPRRGPERSPAYLAYIRTLPCAACKREGRSEAVHTGSDDDMPQKASDLSCVPLTWVEHREYHRIGKPDFERRDRVKFAREVKRLNAAWRKLTKAA